MRGCETDLIPKNQIHKINLGKTAQNQYKLKPIFTIQCWVLLCELLWWPEAQKPNRCGSSYKSSKRDNVVFKLTRHMKILNSVKEGTLNVGSKHDMWVCCVLCGPPRRTGLANPVQAGPLRLGQWLTVPKTKIDTK